MQKAPNRNKTNTLSLFNDQFDGEGGDDTLFAAPSKQKAEEEEEPSEDKVRIINIKMRHFTPKI